MKLSKEAIGVLVDLVENKLTNMDIGDRDDLREKINLQKCLAELRGEDPTETALYKEYGNIPTRGRRQKLSGSLRESH